MKKHCLDMLLSTVNGQVIYQYEVITDVKKKMVYDEVNTNYKGLIEREYVIYALTTQGEVFLGVLVGEVYTDCTSISELHERDSCSELYYKIYLKVSEEILYKIGRAPELVDSIIKHDFIHRGARTFNITSKGINITEIPTLAVNN